MIIQLTSASAAASLLTAAALALASITSALPTRPSTLQTNGDQLEKRQASTSTTVKTLTIDGSLWVPNFITPTSNASTPKIPEKLQGANLKFINAKDSPENPTLITIQLLCDKAENALTLNNQIIPRSDQNYIIAANNSQVYYLTTDFKEYTYYSQTFGSDQLDFSVDLRRATTRQNATCDLFIQMNQPSLDDESKDNRPIFFGRDVPPGNYAGKLVPAPAGTTGYVATSKIPSTAFRSVDGFNRTGYDINCYRPQLINPVTNDSQKRIAMPPNSAVKISVDYTAASNITSLPFVFYKYYKTYETQRYTTRRRTDAYQEGILSYAPIQSLDSGLSGWEVYMNVAGYDWYTDAICIRPLLVGAKDYTVSFQGLEQKDVFAGTQVTRNAGDVTTVETGEVSTLTGPKTFSIATVSGAGLKMIAYADCKCLNTPANAQPKPFGQSDLEPDFININSRESNLHTLSDGSVFYLPYAGWDPKTIPASGLTRLTFVPGSDSCSCTLTLKDSSNGQDLLLPGKTNPTTCDNDISAFQLGGPNGSSSVSQSGSVTQDNYEAFRFTLPKTPEGARPFNTLLKINASTTSTEFYEFSVTIGDKDRVSCADQCDRKFRFWSSATEEMSYCVIIQAFEKAWVNYEVTIALEPDLEFPAFQLTDKQSIYVPGFIKADVAGQSVSVADEVNDGFSTVSPVGLELSYQDGFGVAAYITAQLVCDKPGQPLRLNATYSQYIWDSPTVVTSDMRSYVVASNNTEVFFVARYANVNYDDREAFSFLYVERENGKSVNADCDLFIQLTTQDIQNPEPSTSPFFIGRDVAPVSFAGKYLPADPTTIDRNGYAATSKLSVPFTRTSSSLYATDCFRPQIYNPSTTVPWGSVIKVQVEYEALPSPTDGPFIIYHADKPTVIDDEKLVIVGVVSYAPITTFTTAEGVERSTFEVYMEVYNYNYMSDAICMRPNQVAGKDYTVSFQGLSKDEVFKGTEIQRKAGEVTMFSTGEMSVKTGPKTFSITTKDAFDIKLISYAKCTCANTPEDQLPAPRKTVAWPRPNPDVNSYFNDRNFIYFEQGTAAVTLSNGTFLLTPWYDYPASTAFGETTSHITVIPGTDSCSCEITVKDDTQPPGDLLYPTKTNPNTCGYALNPTRIGPWTPRSPKSASQNGTLWVGSSEAFKVQYPAFDEPRPVKFNLQVIVPDGDFDPEIKASVGVFGEPNVVLVGDYDFECRREDEAAGATVECNKEIEFETSEYAVTSICVELSTAKTFKTPVKYTLNAVDLS
ncbi:hypothetical protein HDV05_004581 [Chytridiales sp. JEL 0842]|nr:hypothetical protein HDV05_004581 [Chytridiales sp. JEL 0842]